MEKKYQKTPLFHLLLLGALACLFASTGYSDSLSFDEKMRILRCKQALTGFGPNYSFLNTPVSLNPGRKALVKKGTLVFGLKATRVLTTLDNDTPVLVGDREASQGYVQIMFFRDGQFVNGEVLGQTLLPAGADELYKELQEKEKVVIETETAARIEREKQNAERINESLQKLDELLKSENPARPFALDYLASTWIENMSKNNPIATLLGGSAEGADADQLVFLAKTLKKRGAIVIFDADAPVASRLSAVLGRRGIGITAEEKTTAENQDPQASIVVSLKNPYLRMGAFAASPDVTITADSITGWGLLFEDKVSGIVDSAGTPANRTLRDWALPLAPKWGVRYYPTLATDAKKRSTRLIGRTKKKTSQLPPPPMPDLRFIPREVYADLPSFARLDSFQRLHDYVKEMQESQGELDRVMKPGTPHVVVFGSSSGDEQFRQLVYDSAFDLSQKGFSISTGGSGGYMEVANDAAIKAGGISIGIPMTGRSLFHEKFIARDSHSVTVASSDYRTRIPLLLYRKDSVVVAPGGRGTGKEIATSFVNASADAESKGSIIFLSSDFYGDLFKALKESALPEAFKARLHLVNTTSEINALFTPPTP